MHYWGFHFVKWDFGSNQDKGRGRGGRQHSDRTEFLLAEKHIQCAQVAWWYGQGALTCINFSEFLLIPTDWRIIAKVLALFIKDYIFLQPLTPFLAPFTPRNDRYIINRYNQASEIMSVVFWERTSSTKSVKPDRPKPKVKAMRCYKLPKQAKVSLSFGNHWPRSRRKRQSKLEMNAQAQTMCNVEENQQDRIWRVWHGPWEIVPLTTCPRWCPGRTWCVRHEPLKKTTVTRISFLHMSQNRGITLSLFVLVLPLYLRPILDKL